MSQQILDAINKLDPNNDNHWTMDGLAKLDTIKFLAGGTSVTREELEKIAPGFNRESLRAYRANQPVENVNAPEPTETGGGVVEPSPAEEGPEERKAKVEAMAKEIDEQSKAILELERVHDEARKKLMDAHAKINDLNTQYQKANPPETEMDTIQKYLESEKKLGQERGEAITAFRESGVTLKDIAKMTTRSALDAHLQNRKRPT